MSADGWQRCPRCCDELNRVKVAAAAKLNEAYGVLDREAFKALEVETAVTMAQQAPHSFREDFEFYGAETGVVTATYGGTCGVCGLKAELRHEVRFYEPDPGVTR